MTTPLDPNTATVEQLDALIGDVEAAKKRRRFLTLRCPAGGMHRWSYQGDESPGYVCDACGKSITKPELKRLTD